MPARLATAIDWLVILFGIAFSVVWTLAFLAYPAFKQLYLGYLPVIAGLALGCVFCLTAVRRSCNRLLDAVHPGAFLAAIAILAFLLRGICIFLLPGEPQNDPAFFHRYAVNLLEGNGYGQVSWRAFFPPGMSFLLAGWYSVTTPSPVAGQWLNAIIGTSWAFLVFAIGRRTIGERAGKWAALLIAIMPTLVLYSATLGYELVLGFIFLATIYLALLILDLPTYGLVLSVPLGLLLGFGSLIKPICIPVPVLLVIWWLLLGLGKRSFSCGILTLASMACVITPWTLRNYRELGEFVLISTNGGVVLYSANNSHTDGSVSPVERLPGEVNEVATDRLRSKAAIDWIKSHPSRFLRLMVNKALFTWGTSTQIMSVISGDRLTPNEEKLYMGFINVFWGALLVQVVTATFTTRVWHERRLYVAFAFLAYIFLIHVISEAMSRHHVPVIGVLVLIASAALSRDERSGLGHPEEASRL
jgi:4-amino-4-deoxy-L-arabinose transferase-like glycosyltransferase